MIAMDDRAGAIRPDESFCHYAELSEEVEAIPVAAQQVVRSFGPCRVYTVR